MQSMTGGVEAGMVAGIEILKTDRRGRVWTPREKRREILEEYDRSGMSAVEFARWSGVKYPTLASWLQKRRRESKETVNEVERSGSLSWVEALCPGPEQPESGAQLVITFGGGIRVEARSGRAAAELLLALGVRGC